jgi:hypothetical protein
MYLIYSVISCLIGILLIGLRGLIQHRRRQERLIRSIREVLLNNGAAARRLTPGVSYCRPSPRTENQ